MEDGVRGHLKKQDLYKCVGSMCYSLIALQLIVWFQLSMSEDYLPQKFTEAHCWVERTASTSIPCESLHPLFQVPKNVRRRKTL